MPPRASEPSPRTGASGEDEAAKFFPAGSAAFQSRTFFDSANRMSGSGEPRSRQALQLLLRRAKFHIELPSPAALDEPLGHA